MASTATLERIAESYLGERVRVSRGTFEGKQRGEAEFVDGVATIRLDGRLWQSGELPTVFLHEVAHLVLGHCPRHTANTVYARPNEIEDLAKRSQQWAIIERQIERNEAAATVWQRMEVKQLERRHGAEWWERLTQQHEDAATKADRLLNILRRTYA